MPYAIYHIPYQNRPKVYICLQISEKVELLLNEREQLHESWTQCQAQYDQMYELSVFMKEAKQIETILSSQEVSNHSALS